MAIDNKKLQMIGWVASCCSIIMYVSYIDQIRLNLHGHPGSLFQPLATTVNCLLWVAYAFLKEKKDYPIMLANFPGIVLGLITFITAL